MTGASFVFSLKCTIRKITLAMEGISAMFLEYLTDVKANVRDDSQFNCSTESLESFDRQSNGMDHNAVNVFIGQNGKVGNKSNKCGVTERFFIDMDTIIERDDLVIMKTDKVVNVFSNISHPEFTTSETFLAQAEQKSEVLQPLIDLEVPVRQDVSQPHEEASTFDILSCTSFTTSFDIENETFVKNMDGTFEGLGDKTLQAVPTVRRGQRVKTPWRSREAFAQMPTAIISPLALLWKVFIFVALATPLDVHAGIIESPENKVVTENMTVIMKCKTDSTTKPLIWAGLDHASNLVSIFDGERVNPTFQAICSVTPNAGRFDLQVKEPRQLALMLKCIEPGAENIERTSELIVIENPTVCVSDNSSDTEYIDLVCSINFSGNWIPLLTWKVNGIQETLTVTNHTERLDGQRVRMTSTLRNVSATEKHKHVCNAKFSLESYKGDVTAKNDPGYDYSPPVSSYNIQCGVAPTLPEAIAPSDPDSYYGPFVGVSVALFLVIIILVPIIIVFRYTIYKNEFHKAERELSSFISSEKPAPV